MSSSCFYVQKTYWNYVYTKVINKDTNTWENVGLNKGHQIGYHIFLFSVGTIKKD